MKYQPVETFMFLYILFLFSYFLIIIFLITFRIDLNSVYPIAYWPFFSILDSEMPKPQQ